MNYLTWLNEWLENYVKPTHKARTYERYQQIVNTHILTNLGDYDLNAITPLLLQKYITNLLQHGNRLTGQALSANTVNGIISILQSSLKMAYTLGLCREYVGNKIVRPKITEKQVACFSLTEQKKMEQYILTSKKYKLYGVIICLYTGLRIGELLALEWADLDFSKGILTVSKTAYDNHGQRYIDRPKTANSHRMIPLPKQLVPVLKDLKRNTQSNWVVVDKNNQPVSVRSYQRSFELLQYKLKIAHKGFHALRHTFATRALECGMDVKSLSEILGHKNTNITLNRYVHSLLEHKQEMMSKLGKILTSAPEK